MKRTKKKNTTFKILIKNYMLFTGVSVFLAIVIFFFATLRIMRLNRVPEKSTMTEIAKMITETNFNENEIRTYLGSDCILEVYRILDGDELTTDIQVANDKLDLIYFFGKNYYDPSTYTDGELECIPLYDENVIVDTFTSHTEDGKELLTIITTRIDQDVIYDIDGSIEIVDVDRLVRTIVCERVNINEYKIVYTTDPNLDRTFYTEKEIEYFSQTTLKEHYVYRYDFSNEEGNFMMIVKPSKHESIVDKYILGNYYVDVIAFLALYFILMLIYIYTINKQFIDPIHMLNDAIKQYATTKTNRKINYTGGVEFEEIISSFEEMKHQIEESNNLRLEQEEDQRRFICNLSHDLKTPVTVINGYLKALNDGVIKPEDYKRYFTAVHKKSTELVDLINNFYEFNQLKHPDYKMEFESVDICEYTREYIINRLSEFEFMNIELSINIPDKYIKVALDRNQFKRVYDNIISNCFKHRDEISLIELNIEEDQYDVIIDICDNGSGVDKALVDTLFDAFVSGDEQKKSGLGLFICKQIVNSHMGDIMYLSNEKYASIFRIIIPKGKERK